MKHFISYNPDTGEIIEKGQCSEETFSAMQADLSRQYPVLESTASPSTHYVIGGVVAAYSEAERLRKNNKPEIPGFTWSNTSKTWIDSRNIVDVRRSKELQINEMRLQKNQTSFTFQGKEIQCDALSMQDIIGINGEIALTGSLPANFPGAWKALDNSYVLIPNVGVWTQFYQAMVTRGAVNFSRSQALKSYINTLTDPAEIAAVTWDTVIPT